MFVYVHFNIGKKFRGILYLVNEHRRFVQLKKHCRIVFCHIPLHIIIQRYITATNAFFLGQSPQHRGFTGLARSRQEYCGV